MKLAAQLLLSLALVASPALCAPPRDVVYEINTHAQEEAARKGEGVLARLEDLEKEALEKQNLAAKWFGSNCWTDALKMARQGCREMDQTQQRRFAVALANCHLKESGLPTYKCEEDMTVEACTKMMDDKAFNAYTDFFRDVESLCYFLETRTFFSDTEDMVNLLSQMGVNLTATLGDHKKLITQIRGGVDDLSEKQEKLHRLAAEQRSNAEQVLSTQAGLLRGQGELANAAKRSTLDLERITASHDQLRKGMNESLDNERAMLQSQASLVEGQGKLAELATQSVQELEALAAQQAAVDELIRQSLANEEALLLAQGELLRGQTALGALATESRGDLKELGASHTELKQSMQESLQNERALLTSQEEVSAQVQLALANEEALLEAQAQLKGQMELSLDNEEAILARQVQLAAAQEGALLAVESVKKEAVSLGDRQASFGEVQERLLQSSHTVADVLAVVLQYEEESKRGMRFLLGSQYTWNDVTWHGGSLLLVLGSTAGGPAGSSRFPMLGIWAAGLMAERWAGVSLPVRVTESGGFMLRLPDVHPDAPHYTFDVKQAARRAMAAGLAVAIVRAVLASVRRRREMEAATESTHLLRSVSAQLEQALGDGGPLSPASGLDGEARLRRVVEEVVRAELANYSSPIATISPPGRAVYAYPGGSSPPSTGGGLPPPFPQRGGAASPGTAAAAAQLAGRRGGAGGRGGRDSPAEEWEYDDIDEEEEEEEEPPSRRGGGGGRRASAAAAAAPARGQKRKGAAEGAKRAAKAPKRGATEAPAAGRTTRASTSRSLVSSHAQGEEEDTAAGGRRGKRAAGAAAEEEKSAKKKGAGRRKSAAQ